MIQLTRINGTRFVLNCEMIKTIEATPDTVITLQNGEKFMVREAVESVVQNTIEYRQRIFRDLPESHPVNRGGISQG